MKLNIEDIIRDNKDLFDAQELPLGYMADFERRLKRPANKRMVSLWSSIAVAAALALVFVLRTPNSSVDVNCTNTSFESEVAELHLYYENQQRQTIAIINKLLETAPSEVKIEINAQLAMMERDDIEFRKGLKAETNREQYLAHEVNYNLTRQQRLEHIQKILAKQ